MASSKDTPNSRPVSGSFSKYSNNTSRPHSHSISLSANNPSHRVNRRKSVNSAASSSTAHAAIAAALREQGNVSVSAHRKSIGSRKGEAHSMNSRPSMHGYFGPNALSELPDQEVVEDNSNDEDMAVQKSKNRNRRASEGSHLIKGEKKSASELRCDTCGKGYKHSSCLTKHMWEHDPAWAITSKLLISKHQQVQLLEAASVLCNINAEVNSDMDVSQIDPSETSSASPEYSGSSEIHDLSSGETTPPPMSEGYPMPDSKRYSSNSNLSRSYRSVRSSSYAESVVSPGFPPQRLSGVSDFRPTTSGTDDGALAAATAGLNFSNTPRTRASVISSEVPPVPPLPQQYQSFNSKSSESTLTNVYSPLGMHAQAFAHNISDERHHRAGSDDRTTEHHLRSHGEDEEMFKMDES